MQLCNALKIVKEAESELHKAQGEVAVKISENYVCLIEILAIQHCVQ